jgi:hypothetical protein
MCISLSFSVGLSLVQIQIFIVSGCKKASLRTTYLS